MGKKRQKQKNNSLAPSPEEIPSSTSSAPIPSSISVSVPEIKNVPSFAPEITPAPAKPKLSRREWFVQQAKELTIVAVFVLAIIGHVAQGSMVIGQSMYPTFNQEVVYLENRIEHLIDSSSFIRDFPLIREPLRGLKYLGTNMVIVNKLSWYFQSWEYGDIVILYSPREPKKKLIKRLLAREGDLLKIDSEIFTIDVGEVFVAGDNLSNSFDSRSFGAVPEGLLQGKVWLQIWPPLPKFIKPNINLNGIQLEKAIRNRTEAEITAEICHVVMKKWKLSQEQVLPESSLYALKIPLPDLLKALENTFFIKAVLNKYKYTEQVDKEFIDLSLFPQEGMNTPAQIAHELYRRYSKKFESEDTRKSSSFHH